MPHVSIHYKVYLPAGHHRQPRNASAVLEPNPPTEADVTDPGLVSPSYVPQLAYVSNGQTQLAQMLFWSITDGVNGVTQAAGKLDQSVGATSLTITAWYFPVGGGGGTGTAIIDDAFSAARGSFIDDTFVAVTSDPSLTNGANVTGVVPTAHAQTLVAQTSVTSTTEPFSRWMSFGAGTAADTRLDVPSGANGLAIAIYERSGTVFPQRPNINIHEQIGGTLIGGVAVDGGGAIVINGRPYPVDPWGPLTVQLAKASLISAGAKTFDKPLQSSASQLAARAVLQSIRTTLPSIEKQAG